MKWKIQPAPATKEHYMFDGSIYKAGSIDAEMTDQEMAEVAEELKAEAKKQKGLEAIQKIVHETTGKVIMVICRMSAEKKASILEEPSLTEEDIARFNRVVFMTEADYKKVYQT